MEKTILMRIKKLLSLITVMSVVLVFTAENNQMAEAFAVKDGKYVYVGDKIYIFI